MTKTASGPTITGDEHLLVYLGKVLSQQVKKKSLSDRLRDARPLPVGEHDVEGTIHFSLHADVGEDYETDRFTGVKLDAVLTWIMATVPGFMEDRLREAAAICIEVERAKLQGRNVRMVVWQDSEGNDHKVTAKEIKKKQKQVLAWADKAQETLAPFAKVIKTTVPAKGRVEVSEVKIKVEQTKTKKPTIPVVRTS